MFCRWCQHWMHSVLSRAPVATVHFLFCHLVVVAIFSHTLQDDYDCTTRRNSLCASLIAAELHSHFLERSQDFANVIGTRQWYLILLSAIETDLSILKSILQFNFRQTLMKKTHKSMVFSFVLIAQVKTCEASHFSSECALNLLSWPNWKSVNCSLLFCTLFACLMVTHVVPPLNTVYVSVCLTSPLYMAVSQLISN